MRGVVARNVRLLPLLLAVAACGDEAAPVEPLPEPTEQGHPFTYQAPVGAPAIQTISVRGSFNEWGERMLQRQPDGSWRALVPLADGRHQYKFFINGAWVEDMCFDETWGHPSKNYWVDPNAADCVFDEVGGQNAVALIGQSPSFVFQHTPSDPAYVSAAGGRVSIRFRGSLGRVQSAAVLLGQQTEPMHLQLVSGAQELWRAAVPAGVTSYRIRVTTDQGVTEHGPFTVPPNLFTAVPWVGEAVGYQIFPERFWNGDPSNDSLAVATDAWHYLHPSFRHPPPVLSAWDAAVQSHHCCHQYFGGDLAGVTQKLDHLDDLGVTLIYMNPIFHAGSAHGYDTFNYLEIAPNFGTEETARTLLSSAHARGMRLMWDFVPNHVGVGHGAFQDAVAKGTASEYWDWFRFKVAADAVQVGNGAHYDAWWGFGTLPELNTFNADVRAHLMTAVRHWTEFGFDAIRVDVPESVRNPRQFFPEFRRVAKSVDPDVYLIGEVWSRDPVWLQGDEFDSLMNYALGLEVVAKYATGEISAVAAAREMTLLYAAYPEASAAMQFNLISSHDTSRLLTLLGGGTLGMQPATFALHRQQLASALLYALPGVPVTFQGDECAFLGAVGGPDEHRYPFQWDRCNASMLAHYQRLGQLKQSVAALRSPAIRNPTATGPVLSFLRGEPGVGDVLALFNAGSDTRVVMLPAGTWVDAAAGTTATGTAMLGPLGWRYLERR